MYIAASSTDPSSIGSIRGCGGAPAPAVAAAAAMSGCTAQQHPLPLRNGAQPRNQLLGANSFQARLDTLWCSAKWLRRPLFFFFGNAFWAVSSVL
jgi:hypothetical protein